MAKDMENMAQETAQVRLLARNVSTILYHGRLHESGREVAIKVWLVPPIMTPSQSQQAFIRFRQEIQTLQQLKHPHILRPLNVRRTAQGFVVVSDYASRGSLQHLLQRNPRRPLPLARALTIVRQIGEALQAAHEKGLVHGNLTPNNVVFLSEEGPDATDQVALTDFYQASLTVGQADMRENEHPNLLFYMAPEQFFDVHTIRTPQSDQYALACLAYELLTGNPPFVASARNTLQGMHENAIPQPPSASNPALPAVCDVVILKALSKQPDERYLDIRSFLAALQLEEQTARTATALSLVADQNTALFSLASEVEAISKATDELISRETSRHAAITLANVNTPASNVVPSGMLTSSFPEQTLLLPTQPPERSQQKSTRTLLLAAMITLLVSLLGCAVFAFALPGITSNNLSANTTSMGGNIVQPYVTYTATKAIDTHIVHQKVSPTVRVIATPTHQVATPTANAQSMLTAHPTFTPTPTSTVMPFTVKPTLECVQPQGLTSYLAKFGYINSSPTNIKIPVGYNNYMSPSSYNNQLPTNFVPGRQDAILQLHASNGSTLTWILDGTSVTANMFSKRCP